MADPRPGTDDPQDPASDPGALLASQAVIQTSDAARYLARLGQHAGKMRGGHPGLAAGRRLRHGPRSARSGEGPPEVQHAEWSADRGTVTLNWGRWTMDAAGATLTVRAEAAGEENLRRIQDLLTARLESLGRREHLTVTWTRA
jgi:hypothetical protein